MNKKEMIAAAAEAAGTTQKQAQEVIRAFLEAIVVSVEAGDPVKLVGFGTFDRRFRVGRTARNPGTGESVEVPDRHVPHFKPGKDFCDRVA